MPFISTTISWYEIQYWVTDSGWMLYAGTPDTSSEHLTKAFAELDKGRAECPNCRFRLTKKVLTEEVIFQDSMKEKEQ